MVSRDTISPVEINREFIRDTARLILGAGAIMLVLLIVWFLFAWFGAQYMAERNLRWNG